MNIHDPQPIHPRRLPRWVILALLAILALSTAMMYQTASLSYETVVFNQVTGPTISPTPSNAAPGTVCRTGNTACAIQNTGMGAHWLTYCIVGGNVSSFGLELEGSNDGVSWVQASAQDTGLIGGNGCGTLEAGGYFNFLRANLFTFAGTSPVLTAWYSGMGTAIPGSGLTVNNKTSQPVTFVPDSTFSTNAQKSSLSSVGSGTLAVDAIHVGNPNASIVYLLLTGTAFTATYMVPASSSITLPIPRGFTIPSVSGAGVGCATSSSGAGDPATACIVTIHFKQFQTVNTQVSTSGTVQKSSTQIGN